MIRVIGAPTSGPAHRGTQFTRQGNETRCFKQTKSRARFTAMKLSFLLPVLAASITAFAATDSCVITNGVNPWLDREFTLNGIDAQFIRNATVPKQRFNGRTLEVPKGTRKALIGIWEGSSFQYHRALGLKRTGKTLYLQTASGQRSWTFDILVFENPPEKLFFKDAGSGIALLALDDAVPAIEELPFTPGTELLAREQEVECQEWPFKPGPRKVKLYVREPDGGVNPNTGFMLLLHNWGGTYKQTVSWCNTLSTRYNVVAISVDYLQSGEPRLTPGIPYDHGYLQAMDCIRALYHVQKQLTDAKVPFNARRCYAAGGSGGGNVSLMVNKLAPNTFACVIDICGMPGLTDEIAYGQRGLNAGYSRDLKSPVYLNPAMQEIRNPGNSSHLKIQHEANPKNKVIIVHGLDDSSCRATDKIEIYQNMIKAGFRPDGHFLTDWHKEGTTIQNTGHSIGSRLHIIQKFADEYLMETGRLPLQVKGPTDIELRKVVRYPVTGGAYEIDYAKGMPIIQFNAASR